MVACHLSFIEYNVNPSKDGQSSGNAEARNGSARNGSARDRGFRPVACAAAGAE